MTQYSYPTANAILRLSEQLSLTAVRHSELSFYMQSGFQTQTWQ